MFAEERLNEIIKLLNNEGRVLVKNLSSKFKVSEDCIRKDLKSLEKQNLLQRTYGGAVPIRKPAHVQTIKSRINLDLNHKQLIAKKALEIIQDNDIIFLDISTTNLVLAELLSKTSKKIKVITNMLDILNILSSAPHIDVICTGGKFNKELSGFIGTMTIENIQKYKVHKAFIGSAGVNILEKSISTFDIDDGITKKAIIDSSKDCYLLIENKKFYIDGMFKFAKILDVNTVITEITPEKDICDFFKNHDISIL